MRLSAQALTPTGSELAAVATPAIAVAPNKNPAPTFANVDFIFPSFINCTVDNNLLRFSEKFLNFRLALYASTIQSPSIATFMEVNARCVGPEITFAESNGSNSAPWQGHANTLFVAE